MRALVLDGPGQWLIQEVPAPVAGAGEVVVAVDRVGVCGTDAEFFRGTQPYLAAGKASYPLRIGHEWCGRVSRVGEGVDPAWVGRRVTGDTMLGCRRCETCRQGRQHLCPDRSEIGVLNGRPGAMAEELAVPVTTLHALPDVIGDGVGALIEPSSLALRAMNALRLPAGERVLVWGAGAIGLAAILFGRALDLEMALVSRSGRFSALAEELGAVATYLEAELDPELQFDAALAASPDAAVPLRALEHLRDGGSMAMVGISGDPSLLEARDLVVRDIGVRGLLSGSGSFPETIELAARLGGELERIIGAVLPFDRAGDAISGAVPAAELGGPKIQVAIGSA